MLFLIAGLLIFLGVHSIRIFADHWRTAMIARRGEILWKAGYSVGSLLGFGLIVWGFGLSRAQPIVLWELPAWTRYLASLLVLAAFILMVAAYIPRNRFKATLGHPMMTGIKAWAFGHLLVNGELHAVLLFGVFLVWGVLGFRAARQRDRAAGSVYPAGTRTGDLATLAIGITGWAAFILYLHQRLIGVSVF
jgi:uncharacterized membrane protein